LECALKDADTHINWENKGIAFQCLISFKIKNGVPFLLAISMQANVFYSKLISLNNPKKNTIYYTLISCGILASWLLQTLPERFSLLRRVRLYTSPHL
jgi:hypothetical protein